MYHLCLVNSMRQWGGAEVWFLETARALRQRGYRTTLVAQPGSELARRALLAGQPVEVMPIRMDGAPWTQWRLWRLFRSTGVTAVVTNMTKDLIASAVPGRLAGVPIILNSRESDFPLKNRLDYRLLFNNLATGVLVNSQATAGTVLRSAPWLAKDRVHLVYKGVDLERFRPAGRWPEPPVVGFVGQLIERKGLTEIMQAWSRIDAAERTDRPRLHLAGEGPLAGTFETWRAGLRHPDRVEMLGYMEKVEDFYQGLTCLVMPSHCEGFGLAAAEAAACGKPVIAAAASSLPEIVVDGQTGLLVPPGDVEQLSRAITTLLDSPGRCRLLGEAAHEKAAACFDREQTLQRLLELTGAPASTVKESHHAEPDRCRRPDQPAIR